jgi:hypothetical protein
MKQSIDTNAQHLNILSCRVFSLLSSHQSLTSAIFGEGQVGQLLRGSALSQTWTWAADIIDASAAKASNNSRLDGHSKLKQAGVLPIGRDKVVAASPVDKLGAPKLVGVRRPA